MPRVNPAFILNSSIPVPSLEEQKRIANYLDEKCRAIDRAVQDIEKSIDALTAYKQSLITETVTHGLHKDVPMKDSGVDWIGEIPTGWKVVPLKYIAKGYKSGPFGSALILSKLDHEGQYLIYTPEHVSQNSVKSDKNYFLPKHRKNEMNQFFVKPGDIIFPIVGSLGRAMLIKAEMPEGVINQRLAKIHLKPSVIDNGFFLRLFGESDFYKPYIELNCRGSFIVNLTKEIVYTMPVILPSIQEQREIANFLDQKCAAIDRAIRAKRKLAETWRTYKVSLIYEAVTGKIDLRS